MAAMLGICSNRRLNNPRTFGILCCTYTQNTDLTTTNSPPRATLTKIALGFILLNATSLNIPLVSSFSGHTIMTKSLCLKSSSNETNTAPNSLAGKKYYKDSVACWTTSLFME
jgi:hypothetical protein